MDRRGWVHHERVRRGLVWEEFFFICGRLTRRGTANGRMGGMCVRRIVVRKHESLRNLCLAPSDAMGVAGCRMEGNASDSFLRRGIRQRDEKECSATRRSCGNSSIAHLYCNRAIVPPLVSNPQEFVGLCRLRAGVCMHKSDVSFPENSAAKSHIRAQSVTRQSGGW